MQQTENLFMPDCIRTMSGVYINVFEPDPDKILIEDIAHALSHQCRFGGHLRDFYTVAQHSLMCAKSLEYEYQLQALMHDASEAYLLDIPSPIKARLSNYKEIENGLMAVIAEKFGFKFPFDKAIKRVDSFMLQWEWDTLVLKRPNPMNVLSPSEARDEFLSLYHELTAECQS